MSFDNEFAFGIEFLGIKHEPITPFLHGSIDSAAGRNSEIISVTHYSLSICIDYINRCLSGTITGQINRSGLGGVPGFDCRAKGAIPNRFSLGLTFIRVIFVLLPFSIE